MPRHTGFSAPTLVRVLARLADADLPEPTQSLPDRLSQWLGWTDAIALSSALGTAPGGQLPAGAGMRASDDAGARECARVREALTRAITGERASAVGRPRQAFVPDDTDYGAYRQHYLAMQQAMEADIGRLRNRLRTMLAASASGAARLAAVDAVMERVLGVHEHNLLAMVPATLERYFERLRRAAEAARAERAEGAEGAEGAQADAASRAAPANPVSVVAWLDTFRADMRRVLLAELEIRLQPVEGLLAALRAR